MEPAACCSPSSPKRPSVEQELWPAAESSRGAIVPLSPPEAGPLSRASRVASQTEGSSPWASLIVKIPARYGHLHLEDLGHSFSRRRVWGYYLQILHSDRRIRGIQGT